MPHLSNKIAIILSLFQYAALFDLCLVVVQISTLKGLKDQIQLLLQCILLPNLVDYL